MADFEIVDEQEGRRFVYREDGQEAELTYRLNGKRLVLLHTGVPDELEGRGIGGRLVRAAVERARVNGETIVPSCPFARKWIEDHSEDVAGVSVDSGKAQ